MQHRLAPGLYPENTAHFSYLWQLPRPNLNADVGVVKNVSWLIDDRGRGAPNQVLNLLRRGTAGNQLDGRDDFFVSVERDFWRYLVAWLISAGPLHRTSNV